MDIMIAKKETDEMRARVATLRWEISKPQVNLLEVGRQIGAMQIRLNDLIVLDPVIRAHNELLKVLSTKLQSVHDAILDNDEPKAQHNTARMLSLIEERQASIEIQRNEAHLQAKVGDNCMWCGKPGRQRGRAVCSDECADDWNLHSV